MTISIAGMRYQTLAFVGRFAQYTLKPANIILLKKEKVLFILLFRNHSLLLQKIWITIIRTLIVISAYV